MKIAKCGIAVLMLASIWPGRYLSLSLAGDPAPSPQQTASPPATLPEAVAKAPIRVEQENYGSIRQSPQQTTSRPASLPAAGGAYDPNRIQRENYGSIRGSSQPSKPHMAESTSKAFGLAIKQENYGSISQSSRHTTTRPADSRPVVIHDPTLVQRETYGSIRGAAGTGSGNK